jgi:urea transport system ATP-binding protein
MSEVLAAQPSATPLLEITEISKVFGGIHALSGVSLNVHPGELICIVGPNGCGKTTLFNVISGALRPDDGAIHFRGENTGALKVHEISRLGIGRKFQVPGIFGELSAADNLRAALSAAKAKGAFGLIRLQRQEDEVRAILDLVALGARAEVPAGELAHGEKQWLEIAMVLAGKPKLILLDEPTAGMTASETAATADLIRRIADETAAAIIVIEHDIQFVRRLECPVVVMMKGQILRRGSYAEISADPAVREAYLGKRA